MASKTSFYSNSGVKSEHTDAIEAAIANAEHNASLANDSAVSANSSLISAQTAQAHAETAETNAETAQAISEAARDDSIVAKDQSVVAKVASETAKTASETAKGLAETAAQNAASSASSATTNGAYQVSLAADQVALATTQANLATTNGAAQVALAANQAALATTNGAAQVQLAADQVALATTDGAAQVALATAQAGLATTNGAAQVALATTQVGIATTKANEAAASASSINATELTAQANALAASQSAAAAATALDQFDDRYLGSKSAEPTLDNDGNALVQGALYFSSSSASMQVYDGANWIAASSSGVSSLDQFEYTATANQTVFTGTDEHGLAMSFISANMLVTLNGIILDSSDYTTTNGISVTLDVGATQGDLVNVYAFKSFQIADTVSASTGGTFNGQVTFGANVIANGTVDGRDIAADGTKLDGIASGANNYSHPSAHPISMVTGLQSALNGKVDDSQVLTNVPSGALFTDTVFSGNYNSLSNRPSLFDGNYNSLSNKPSLFNGSYNSLSNRPSLFDGNYNSLSNKPTIPTNNVQLLNGAGFTTYSANQGLNTNNSPTFSTLNADTIGLAPWSITESGGVLYFKHNGSNKMKLDSNGNITVTGNVTAYGSV